MWRNLKSADHAVQPAKVTHDWIVQTTGPWEERAKATSVSCAMHDTNIMKDNDQEYPTKTTHSNKGKPPWNAKSVMCTCAAISTTASRYTTHVSPLCDTLTLSIEREHRTVYSCVCVFVCVFLIIIWSCTIIDPWANIILITLAALCFFPVLEIVTTVVTMSDTDDNKTPTCDWIPYSSICRPSRKPRLWVDACLHVPAEWWSVSACHCCQYLQMTQ